MRAKRGSDGVRRSLIRWGTGLALLGNPAGAAPAPGAAGAEEPEPPRASARGVNDGASDRSGSADRRPSNTPRASASPRVPTPGALRTPTGGLVADAGDDLETVVGRQVTLNALRSRPQGALGYRWIQVGGPPVSSAIEHQFIYAFVPTEPGRYRFALVVAAEGAISKPDYVTVEARPGDSEAKPPADALAAAPIDADPLAARAAAAVRRVEDAESIAPRIAEAFERVVERIDLYHSYADVHRELALRLETILPADPDRRATWAAEVFEPLSAELIARFKTEGFDLDSARGRRRRLQDSTRDALAERFQSLARGFRNVAARGGPDGPAPVARGDQVVR